MLTNLKGTLIFLGQYIEEPYWPERAQLIDIDKQGGVSRARTEAGRDKALKAQLAKLGMTHADFEGLNARANRPFHTAADLVGGANGHDPAEIVIMPEKLLDSLVHAADVAPASTRICPPEQLRTILLAEPVFLGKHAPDGVWTRPVVPKKNGVPLSNQRGTRSSLFIENATGSLVLIFDSDTAKQQKVRDFIDFAGSEIGIGASRKMNKGRYRVEWK
jgi:hypothetical protein